MYLSYFSWYVTGLVGNIVNSAQYLVIAWAEFDILNKVRGIPIMALVFLLNASLPIKAIQNS